MAQFERKKNIVESHEKQIEQSTSQPEHQHIEAHITFHRASRTHQTASSTPKLPPEEAARFLVDDLRDCPQQTG